MDGQTKTRKPHSSRIVKWLVFAVFVVYAVTLLTPFLWMIVSSFKTTAEFTEGNIYGFPKRFTFENYAFVLNYASPGTDQNIFGMFLMSVLVTVCGTFLNVMLSAMSAYVVAKYKFPGRKIVFMLAVISMTVPIVGTLPAQIRMMELFRLDDSFWGLMFLYSGCFGFNFILLHGAFSTISWTYAEAVEIDGAGRFTIFFRIMLPIAAGPIAAVAVLQAIALWSDYSTPFLFMRSTPTLAVGLQSVQEELSGNFPAVFAAIIVAIVPMIVLYACFQKTILKNTVAGGLKG